MVLGLGSLACSAALRGSLTASAEDAPAKTTAELQEEQARERRESYARSQKELAEHRERQDAAREAQQARTLAAIDARRPKPPPEVPRDPIADWLTRAPAQCRIELNHRACSAAPAGISEAQRSECTAKCKESVMVGLEARVAKAVESCAAAEGPPKCELDLATVDVNGPAGKQITDEGREKLAAHCVKECGEKRAENARFAKESTQAEKVGENLVLAYKRCMMAVDQTLAARKEWAYDRDLYDKRMQGVDARCRKQHRCDWLEEYSDFECVYGN